MRLEIVKNESEYLARQIKKLEKMVDKTQNYVLSCNKNSHSYRWNCRNVNREESFEIPRSEENKARKLAINTYNRYLLEDCVKEKKALDYYIKHHGIEDGKGEHYLANPEVCRLLALKCTNKDEEIKEWANADYPVNHNHSEDLVVKSAGGRMVRSKSEAIIDMLLLQHNIPHRYEDEFIAGEITLRPDFTIRHPQTGAYFLWEHLGLMDNNDYCANAYEKMRLYAMSGFYPMINLIITSETRDHPTDVELVSRIIEYFFGQ